MHDLALDCARGIGAKRDAAARVEAVNGLDQADVAALDDVVVLEDLKLDSPKTKEFLGVLSALDLKGSTLIVGQGTNKNLTLASRNISTISLATSDSFSTYDVLRPNKLVFTRGAFEQIEARIAKD